MPFDHIKDDHEAEQDRRGETLQQQRLKQVGWHGTGQLVTNLHD